MYKPINGWTKEKILTHIRKEFKGLSVDSTGDICLYRGLNGAKCAIGMFIPDAKYNPDMEQTTIHDPFLVRYDLYSDMPLTNDAMADLQIIHDKSNYDDDCLVNMIKYVNDNVED